MVESARGHTGTKGLTILAAGHLAGPTGTGIVNARPFERVDAVFKPILLAPMILALATAPAFAKTTLIAELGSAPLLGTITSTAQMRERVAGNQAFVAQAARKLGLSANEYRSFSSAIAESRVAWVTMPRHLDAMSWRSGSTVYVLHDVVIPRETHGWEVDLRSGNQRIAVYLPAACGNVSIVRTAFPALARHRPAAKVPPPAVAAVPSPVEEPAPPVAVIPDDTPVIAPAVVAKSDFPPAAARHHPLFLAPLLFGLAALSGGSGNGPVVAPPEGCP